MLLSMAEEPHVHTVVGLQERLNGCGHGARRRNQGGEEAAAGWRVCVPDFAGATSRSLNFSNT